jgi:hypothetical protein
MADYAALTNPPYGAVNAGEKIFRIPYPRPRNLAYPVRVVSDEGRFLEALLISPDRLVA